MTTITAIVAGCEHESEMEVHERHKREKRELQARIQSLKKTAMANDKKKRKEIQRKVVNLETELKVRHAEELSKLLDGVNLNSCENSNNLNDCGNGRKLSKTQRRRMRKEQQLAEKEKRFLASVNDTKSIKDLENELIYEKLKKYALKIHQIEADGNCLYNAIIHQLQILDEITKPFDIKELRTLTSDYIREHKDDFMPFMIDFECEDVVIDDRRFIQYCDDIKNKVVWAGQLEIKAISNILRRPIRIIQAENEVKLGSDCPNRELIITYHKHLYRLGEHYNSTVVDDGQTSANESDF